MLKENYDGRISRLTDELHQLIVAKPIAFKNITPSAIPVARGVYVITARINGKDVPYYVGRTKNLRQRIYNNHLMGPFSNARLKKHLVSSGECSDITAAKEFIRSHCSVQWIEIDEYRDRGALEGFATGLLFPKHSIDEEH